MMNIEADYEEENDSYSSDEDYVPSREESDYIPSDEDEDKKEKRSKKARKRKKKPVKSRKKRGRTKMDDYEEEEEEEEYDSENSENNTEDNNTEIEEEETTESKLPEIEKEKADSLWADFLKDVDPPAKSKQKQEPKLERTTSSEMKQESTNSVSTKKKTITQIFDFAGESVPVTKEVDEDSEEAQAASNKDDEKQESIEQIQGGVKRSGNIGNVLGKILNKKPKMSTLEKSKLDWETFKKDENLNEEIHLHNKGKDGYLDRQAFLQRVDVRQFEVEKSIREINRSKR